jgi:hypothetical protein
MGQFVINRQGPTWTSAFLSTQSAGGGGAQTKYQYYRGRVAYRFGETGATADWATTQTNFRLAFPITKPVTTYQDDFRCWQFTFIGAWTTGGTEAGLEIGPGVVNMAMFTTLNDGVGILMRAANQVNVCVRQSGVLTADTAIASTAINGASYDIADWHVYQIRIIGATPSTDAQLKVLSDGIVRQTFSWGAGTILPSMAQGTGLGWSVSIGSRLGDWYLAQTGMNISAAATEAGLL